MKAFAIFNLCEIKMKSFAIFILCDGSSPASAAKDALKLSNGELPRSSWRLELAAAVVEACASGIGFEQLANWATSYKRSKCPLKGIGVSVRYQLLEAVISYLNAPEWERNIIELAAKVIELPTPDTLRAAALEYSDEERYD